jgi:hypothetical protein
MARGDGPRIAGAIIAYQLRELPLRRKARFTEKILGQDRKVGDRTYHRQGILDQIPHWKVSRGVLLVRSEHRVRVVKALRQWTREVEWWEVTLTRTQARRLDSLTPRTF